MTKTKDYVVVAPGITHDGCRYPKGALVQLEPASAAYHERLAAIRSNTTDNHDTGTNPITNAAKQSKIPKGEKE